MKQQNTRALISFRYLLYLIFTPLMLNAQSLSVVDSESLEPIPYASVEIHEIQVQSYCDENVNSAIDTMRDIAINTTGDTVLNAESIRSFSIMYSIWTNY